MNEKNLMKISGIITIIIGALFLLLPSKTLLVYIEVIGIIIILASIIKFFITFKKDNRIYDIISTIVYLLLGLSFLLFPFNSFYNIIFLISILILISGILTLISVFQNKEFGMNENTLFSLFMILFSITVFVCPLFVVGLEIYLSYVVGFIMIMKGINEFSFAKYIN